MSLRNRIALSREDGQSVVFFVLVMTVVFGMLALVVNVGNLFQAHRRAQATADAAVLAAAHGWSQDFGTDGNDVNDLLANTMASAQTNWPGTPQPGGAIQDHAVYGIYPDVNVMQAKVTRDVPSLFGSLIGILSAPVTAVGTARVGIPGTIRWAAPLAMKCKLVDPTNPASPCDTNTASYWQWGADVTFDFDDLIYNQPDPIGNPSQGSTFGPVRLTPESWATALGCDPATGLNTSSGSRTCDPTSVTASTSSGEEWYERIAPTSEPGGEVDEASLKSALLNNLGLHLVAVYNEYDASSVPPHPKSFHVIGWAAFRVKAVGDTTDGIQVTGAFEKFFMPADGPIGGRIDFGVRSVELFQDIS